MFPQRALRPTLGTKLIQNKFNLSVWNHFQNGFPLLIYTLFQVLSGIFASAFILISSIKLTSLEFNKLTISLSLIGTIISLFGGAYLASIKQVGSLIENKNLKSLGPIYYKLSISYLIFAVGISGSLLLASKYGFDSTKIFSDTNYYQMFIICIVSILIGFNSALVQAHTKWIILGVMGFLTAAPRVMILFIFPPKPLDADYIIEVLTGILIIVCIISYVIVIQLIKLKQSTSSFQNVTQKNIPNKNKSNYTGSIISNLAFMLLINFDIIIVNELYGIEDGKIYAICAALTKIGYALVLLLMALFLPYFIRYKSNLSKFKNLILLSTLTVLSCSIIFNFFLFLYLSIFGEQFYNTGITEIKILLVPTTIMISILSLLYALEIAFLSTKGCFVFYVMIPVVSVTVVLINYFEFNLVKAISLVSISLIICLIISTIKFITLNGLKYANY